MDIICRLFHTPLPIGLRPIDLPRKGGGEEDIETPA